MVEGQLRRRGIHDERVLAAMGEVPRERFVPESERRRAYRDGALRIGEGQTISQPWIVACMAQLLELRGDETVLEVGTGSGYAAAVLSRLCAQVVTIERYDSLARVAAEALAELGYDNVEVRTGDGARGAPDRAPFLLRRVAVVDRMTQERRTQLVELARLVLRERLRRVEVERPRRWSSSSRPAPPWCARSRAGAASS